jgi:hypothetical protein
MALSPSLTLHYQTSPFNFIYDIFLTIKQRILDNFTSSDWLSKSCNFMHLTSIQVIFLNLIIFLLCALPKCIQSRLRGKCLIKARPTVALATPPYICTLKLVNRFRKIGCVASWSQQRSGRAVINTAQLTWPHCYYGWSFWQNSCTWSSAPS